MIAIENISGNIGPTGVHRYRLRVNSKVICEFDHTRERGLSACLAAASRAAYAAQIDEDLALLQKLGVDIDEVKL